jgi:hypothetical protein
VRVSFTAGDLPDEYIVAAKFGRIQIARLGLEPELARLAHHVHAAVAAIVGMALLVPRCSG